MQKESGMNCKKKRQLKNALNKSGPLKKRQLVKDQNTVNILFSHVILRLVLIIPLGLVPPFAFKSERLKSFYPFSFNHYFVANEYYMLTTDTLFMEAEVK